MPDHANLAVTFRACGFDGCCQCFSGTMELVIAGNDLEWPGALVTKHDEIAQQGKETALVEHTTQQGFHLAGPMRL